MVFGTNDTNGKNNLHLLMLQSALVVGRSKGESLSNEIKKARIRELAAQYHIELCLKCYEPTEECKCSDAVVAGKLFPIREYLRIKEGLGAVRP